MKRALASLSTWQKMKLAFNILTTTDEISKEEVEKCKNKDLLESMMEELAGKKHLGVVIAFDTTDFSHFRRIPDHDPSLC